MKVYLCSCNYLISGFRWNFRNSPTLSWAGTKTIPIPGFSIADQQQAENKILLILLGL